MPKDIRLRLIIIREMVDYQRGTPSVLTIQQVWYEVPWPVEQICPDFDWMRDLGETSFVWTWVGSIMPRLFRPPN